MASLQTAVEKRIERHAQSHFRQVTVFDVNRDTEHTGIGRFELRQIVGVQHIRVVAFFVQIHWHVEVEIDDARRNAAGSGAIFAPSGSPRDGLTAFGREVVRECEAFGVIVDLAHINLAGFEEILTLTTRPAIVSHTNARRYYDIERNISDEQIKMIGERRGVIGVNAVKELL